MLALSQRVAVAMLMLSGLRIAAQVPAEVPNAARIQAYVAAFNGGEDHMADFLKNNVADSALQQRSVADRLAIYRQLHQRMKSIEVLGIPNVQISGQAFAVTARVRTGSGEDVDLTFTFDPQPPNKLISLRVEDAGGPGPRQTGSQPTPQPIAQADFIKKVAAYLDDAAGKDEFSGVVLLARDGKPVFQKEYGFADKEKRIANNLNTKFNLGSIDKAFTRICIEQLAQKGKLSLDDTLGKYLPGYPNREAAEKVTIAQLLNMTSGIGDFFGERFVAADKTKVRTLADYLPFFADKPLLFPPGTGNRYSNGGYIVLGLIIEKISGQSYYNFVKQNVFQPAGMKDSDWYALDQQVPNRAEGYTRHGGDARRSNREMQPARGSSAGGGYSTAPDLLRFANALAAHKLPSSNAGLGIAGGSPGVNAALESDPRGNTIIVLSNYDPPAAEATARQIRLWMAGLKAERTP
jgi:D-alanyl-D-alanine carboxypeptidase